MPPLTATIEDAVASLERILREDLPEILLTIESERKDGIKLEPIRSFEWEEVKDAIKSVPCAMMIGDDEIDDSLKDQLYNARITLFVVLTDRSKNNLTKMLYRYADAVKRVLRPARNRTLRGVIVSAKVERINYSPTFASRDNLYARDFQASILLRVPRDFPVV